MINFIIKNRSVSYQILRVYFLAAAAAFAEALINLAALRSATSLISFSSIFLRSSRNSLNSAGSFKEKF